MKLTVQNDNTIQLVPTGEPFALFQYEGFHSLPPSSNPTIESYYSNERRGQYKLVKQIVLQGQDAPHTTFYHYDSKYSRHYPAAGFMYKGIVESIDTANEKDLIASLTYGRKSGNVIEATLKRENLLKPLKGLQEIEARYQYQDTEIESPMIAVSYYHVMKGWQLHIVYAGGVCGEDMPHISYVDYIDKRGVKSRTHFLYTHPLHPTMQTMLLSTGNIMHRKIKIATPEIVKSDPFKLIESVPRRSIHHDDLLLTFKMTSRKHGGFINQKWIQFYSRPATTQRKRVDLWTLWRSGYIEGVHAMDIDELFLREEPILKDYWLARDRGRKREAKLIISSKFVQISNLVVQDTPNTRTHLQMKVSDLVELGCGGDASQIMTDDRATELNSEILQILSVDSGTWPTGGGGVGSCRRDLIDNLSRARWTAMAEIGTDSEMVQKGYQAERYVNAIHYIPLWGLDLGTPNQHVLSGIPYGVLDLKRQRTTDLVVHRHFLPLLKEFIKGCCAVRFKKYEITRYGEMFVKMHLYFQEFDWLSSWNHEATRITWYKTWFNILNSSWASQNLEVRLLQSEMPTLEDLDSLYELLTRLLFPLAAYLPRLSVTHASHHGIQAILGVISKVLYGSSLIVWDHGILWRERLLALSTLDPSIMSKFVQFGFVGLTRLVCALVYGHANCVCPCTSIQNVQWECWLGGRKFQDNGAYTRIRRNISPILNGMDVNRFRVNKAREAKLPTSVMLSHVNRIKDVMNAIEAAAIIIHGYGLKEYRLLIYGSKESDPIYANSCANAIVALNLTEHVFLCGLANPSVALPEGWLFINSSISEGLPLAIGEAGLCGLPVVCTDVGGSREVFSDAPPGEPIDPTLTYGRLVPPRSPSDLAVAQLEIMTMTNGMEKIVDKNCNNVVSLEKLKQDPDAMLRRMMDPLIKAKRRHLGLMLRSRVYRVFPISRYLRQHEQLLWIAALQCDDWELSQMVHHYVYPRKRQFKSAAKKRFRNEEEDNSDNGSKVSRRRQASGEHATLNTCKTTGEEAIKEATYVAIETLAELIKSKEDLILLEKTTKKAKEKCPKGSTCDPWHAYEDLEKATQSLPTGMENSLKRESEDSGESTHSESLLYKSRHGGHL
ncbi:uncharacterized protein LOC135146429 [Zophobas morio]|uniref:uncharacterized protein LOC135146429 n=1 Tax=Zophobas morio TaxID=2755281 RepID=UPI0030829DD9